MAGTVQVAETDPHKTSQVCSDCLKEGPHKDLSERVHTCERCGLVLDRDTNAAVNILARWAEPAGNYEEEKGESPIKKIKGGPDGAFSKRPRGKLRSPRISPWGVVTVYNREQYQ